MACWSDTLPRTLLISVSTHLVQVGPAALPSAMQSPSRTASRGDMRVKLHQPSYPDTLPRLVSVRPQMLMARLITGFGWPFGYTL